MLRRHARDDDERSSIEIRVDEMFRRQRIRLVVGIPMAWVVGTLVGRSIGHLIVGCA